MTLERTFNISSGCLIASGFAAIAATGSLSWFPVVLFGAALIANMLGKTARLRKRLPRWLIHGLLILCILYFVSEMLLQSRPFLVALAHLAFLLSAMKLITLSKDRDYVFLYWTSFTMLLATPVFSFNPAFGIFFLIFLFSGVQTFILLEIRRRGAELQNSIQQSDADADIHRTLIGPTHTFPSRHLFLTAATTTLLILLIAIPLFLFLPRAEYRSRRQPADDTVYVSGFSKKVELGRSGSVRLSDSVVMRVRVSTTAEKMPADLKWRGLSFDHYDGRTWQQTDTFHYPVPIREGHFKLHDSAIGTDWLYQTYYLEALSTDVVFAAHTALAVSRDVGSLTVDSSGNLFARPHALHKVRYAALSDLSRPDPEYMHETESPSGAVRSTYLQLPATDTRIKELAELATASAATRYEKATALEQYLKTHYEYTTELKGTPEPGDPIATFLFDTREGHCEYFASAMAIMLRYLGIPSRLVNGFRAGEYNPIGNNWVVRQYDAHSWTEVYLPPYGWVEFDPTPTLHRLNRPSIARFWSNLNDAIDLWWWEHIVHYDNLQRNALVSSMYAASGNIRSSIYRFFDSLYKTGSDFFERILSGEGLLYLESKRYLIFPAILIILLVISPVRKIILRSIRHFWNSNRSYYDAKGFYAEALELLSRRGIVRAPEQTPMELVHSLGKHPAAIPLHSITRLYNSIRFGTHDSSSLKKEVQDLLQSLRRSLK